MYLAGFENGFHAVMALGIVAAYAYVSEDPALNDWLGTQLIEARELPRIAAEKVYQLCDFGAGTNFSNVNMAMMGYWLALRFLPDPAARATLQAGFRDGFYARPGKAFQPRDHDEVHDCSVNANDAGLCSWDPALFAEPCVASDGVTLLELLGCAGWKCNGVASEALPWELVPPSNYHWRSSPHDVNGGDDGSGLLPGVDFRFAYWMGRWTAL